MEHPRGCLEYPTSPRLRAGAAWHTTLFPKDFLANALVPAAVCAAALAMLLARYYGNGPSKARAKFSIRPLSPRPVPLLVASEACHSPPRAAQPRAPPHRTSTRMHALQTKHGGHRRSCAWRLAVLRTRRLSLSLADRALSSNSPAFCANSETAAFTKHTIGADQRRCAAFGAERRSLQRHLRRCGLCLARLQCLLCRTKQPDRSAPPCSTLRLHGKHAVRSGPRPSTHAQHFGLSQQDARCASLRLDQLQLGLQEREQ